MSKIKSAVEIAMKKTEEVEELTTEEKEKIETQKQIKSMLSKFYKRKIDSSGLWEKLKDKNQSMLKETQRALIDSLRPKISTVELPRRKKGILAVESLKTKQNISALESVLNSIEALRKDYEKKKESTAERLKSEIEENPKLRMQPVKTPDGKTVMRMTMSADEAVKKKLADSLSDYEERYNREFDELLKRLKEEIE